MTKISFGESHFGEITVLLFGCVRARGGKGWAWWNVLGGVGVLTGLRGRGTRTCHACGTRERREQVAHPAEIRKFIDTT